MRKRIPEFVEFRLRSSGDFSRTASTRLNTLLMVDRLVKEAFFVEVQTITAL